VRVVRSFGKSNEAILAAQYNLLSGHLMQDMLNAPRMAVRGMIGPKIHGVKDKAAVRRLIDKALAQDKAAHQGDNPSGTRNAAASAVGTGTPAAPAAAPTAGGER
jgi:hypothetical protein